MSHQQHHMQKAHSYHRELSQTSSSSPSTSSPSSTRSSSISSHGIRGILLKKGVFSGWTEAYYVLESGMLLEFKNEHSSKPQRAIYLTECTVQLADTLIGKPHSFVIICPKMDSLFLRAKDETKLVEWVSAIGSYCSAEVQWGTDAFMEAFVDAVIVSSEDGTIIRVNQKVCELFGYAKSELMGKPVAVLMPASISAMHDTYITNFLKTGEKKLIGKPRSVPVLHKNGTNFRATLSLGEKVIDGKVEFIATLREEKVIANQDDTKTAISDALDASLAVFGAQFKEKLFDNLKDMFAMLDEHKRRNEQLKAKVAGLEKIDRVASNGDLQALVVDVTQLQIHEKLAATGGSGATVYSCTVGGWMCAMKELNIAHATRHSIDNLLAEIRLLESLPNHKNIVRYLFHQHNGSTVRLFMTRYSNTLSHIIKTKAAEGGFFTQAEIAKFSLDILCGLEVLHNMNIIHRDLKTDNIFYNKDVNGSVLNLAIGDMDTAKELVQTGHATTVIGTPGYMAPEVLSSNRYTCSADVWSFGMVLYEMMTLLRPYSSENIFNVPKLAMDGELPPIPAEIQNKYVDMEKVWLSCVVLDANARPSISKLKNMVIALL